MKTSNKILLTVLITFTVIILLVTAALRINSTKVQVIAPNIVTVPNTNKPADVPPALVHQVKKKLL